MPRSSLLVGWCCCQDLVKAPIAVSRVLQSYLSNAFQSGLFSLFSLSLLCGVLSGIP